MYDVYIRNSGTADSYFRTKACWWNHQLHPGLAVKWSVNRRWSASGSRYWTFTSPVKSYFGYLIVGFVAAVYLDIPILGVALIGFAIALIIYKNKSVEAVSPVVAGGMDEDE